jgi:hypothetical protein
LPQGLSVALSPEDGTVVTGLVRLALQQPDPSLCRVEYAIDELAMVLASSEPPFFPAAWDSTALADAGAGRTARVRAYAFAIGSGTCDDVRSLGEVSLRVATAATCDPAWGRPTCLAPSSACGSGRLVEGARAPGEPVCGGAVVEPTGPTIERILVRSRDGRPLEPGVPARIEVELGGAGSLSRVDVHFLSVDLAVTGTSRLLGIAEDVGAAVDRGERVGLDFVVGPTLVPGDPVALQYVMAIVADGTSAADETLAFAAPDRTPPIVRLDAPSPGSVLTNPVVLRAIARDASRVESVTFRAGDQVVGTVSAPPFEIAVQRPEGNLSLLAEARDDAGNVGASEIVPAIVDVTPPLALWVAPSEGAAPLDGTVTLSVHAVDPDLVEPRAAERVEFWAGEQLIGTLTAPTEWEASGWPRWDLAWDTTAFASGPNLLRAVAIDRVGLRSEARVWVLVNQPPTLRLIRPVDGERTAGSIRFVVEVADDLFQPQLEFLVDGRLVAGFDAPGPGQQPTSVEYVWAPMSLPAGDHRATARACDPTGLCVESSAVVHVIDESPPHVVLTAPAAGTVVSGPVALQANAWDDVAVTRVDYYADGTFRGSATAPPYAVTWDPAPFQGRTVTLVAVAYDAEGNGGASDPVDVTVRDTTPPVVSLTAPAADSVLFKTATLAASASDNVGVTRVQFVMDGAVVASDDVAPYAATLDVRKMTRGTHLLAAVASDAQGNATTSASTPVYVK